MSDTPKSIFEEKIPAQIEKDPAKAQSINAVYQFNITGDGGGTWVIDFTKDEEWVTEGPSEDADCTVTVSDGDFVDMVSGKLPGPQAFMMGKLKIEGDMGLAMKLGQVLG